MCLISDVVVKRECTSNFLYSGDFLLTFEPSIRYTAIMGKLHGFEARLKFLESVAGHALPGDALLLKAWYNTRIQACFDDSLNHTHARLLMPVIKRFGCEYWGNLQVLFFYVSQSLLTKLPE